MNKRWISAVAVLLVAAATVVAGDVKLDGVKCIVAPRDVQASKSASYRDANVYFCCGGCMGKFAKTPEKFATAANQQLVQTEQFEQTGCPFSGGDIDSDTMVSVNGTQVGFCCGKCKGTVEAADDAKKLELVFGDKAFEKGFKKVAAEG